jgi:hypothetical protein
MTTLTLAPALRDELQAELGLGAARLMAQVAMLGIKVHLFDDAQHIVDGLAPVFGDYACVGMSVATLSIALGRHREALDLIDTLARNFPAVSAIRAVQAMLKNELGLSGWQALAEQVLADNDDQLAVEMATQLLRDVPRPGARRVAPSFESTGMRFA